MKQFKFFLIFALIFIFVIPSYAYKKIKCFVLYPPEQILLDVKRIAVLDFEGEGNYGRNFSDYLISRLLKQDRGIYDIESGFLGMGEKKEGKSLQEGTTTNVFDIVERSRLMQVIDEQKLSATGFIDETQALSIGKILGVDAIIMGNISYTQKDKPYQAEVTYYKNKKAYTKIVDCLQREVSTTVRARIISTQNGKILGSKESTRFIEDKKCDDEINGITPVNQMVEACLKGLSWDVANYMAPVFVLEEYELEKIKTKPFKKIADEAAGKAEDLEIDNAYILYKSIYEKDPYNPKLLHNMGILNEVVGNFVKAKEFYEMALQLDDNSKYQKALKRVEKNVAYSEALEKMGITIREHLFEVSQEEIAKASALKIEIKGKREERIPVYAKPETGSEVVGRVPGGVNFTVIDQQGEWFRIKLLDGKEGYVHKDRVKVK